MECKNYVGVACVDGSCPIADKDDYRNPTVEICMECWLNRGCDDCALLDTSYCENQEFAKGVADEKYEVYGN